VSHEAHFFVVVAVRICLDLSTSNDDSALIMLRIRVRNNNESAYVRIIRKIYFPAYVKKTQHETNPKYAYSLFTAAAP